MASKNVSAIRAALNDCTTVEEWETLIGCMEIPEELFSDVYSRLIDLSWQDQTGRAQDFMEEILDGLMTPADCQSVNFIVRS